MGSMLTYGRDKDGKLGCFAFWCPFKPSSKGHPPNTTQQNAATNSQPKPKIEKEAEAKPPLFSGFHARTSPFKFGPESEPGITWVYPKELWVRLKNKWGGGEETELVEVSLLSPLNNRLRSRHVQVAFPGVRLLEVVVETSSWGVQAPISGTWRRRL